MFHLSSETEKMPAKVYGKRNKPVWHTARGADLVVVNYLRRREELADGKNLFFRGHANLTVAERVGDIRGEDRAIRVMKEI